ncbi:MAG TPA: hypothetical protein VKY27_11995 [Bacteriovoracaceae bacterium]|nr:hypothetical protein [Bacteriovoracaceae bacterium]
MQHPSLKDTFIFSNYCWESTSNRIRYIVLALVKKQRIFYVEPPILGMTSFARLNEFYSDDGVIVLTPYLPLNTDEEERNEVTQELLRDFIAQENISYFDSWYFSYAAWDYSHEIKANNIIYYIEREEELGFSLAEIADYIFSSQRIEHERCIHIADGVDYDHFAQARLSLIKPDDLSSIPSPQVGCYGIQDQTLIEEVARSRPDLQFIFLTAPGEINLENVHYLGPKNFYSLPLYLSQWNIALTSDHENYMMELLASGTPVVYINDDIEIEEDLVHQANNLEEIIFKIDLALTQTSLDPNWIDRVDAYLQNKSWDHQVELILQGQRINSISNITPPLTLTH